MAQPVRMGVTLPVPPDAQATLRLAEWAEAEGFDAVWFADTGEVDALTLSAAVALRTQRVRIGIAVVPAYTRTPAVLAATTATLAQLAPGRIVLGLGASSHLMIERSFVMAEELALDQVFGNGGAIHLDESLIFAQALEVNGVGY